MTTYRDQDLQAENDRLRAENERLVEALVLSRPAKPVRAPETKAERTNLIAAMWGGAATGLVVVYIAALAIKDAGYFWTPSIAAPLIGGVVGVALVRFHRWAMRVGDPS